MALPSSSLDWKMRDGLKEIPIEERGAEEVKHADGWLEGRQVEVRVTPEGSPAANYGFDVTPRRSGNRTDYRARRVQGEREEYPRAFSRAGAVSKYIKFTCERTAARDHAVQRFCRIERIPAETSPASTDRRGFKWHWVRQSEHKGRRDRQFLHHRFGNRRNTRTDAGGLRKSGSLRFRKELAPIRGFRDSLIGIADARRSL